MEAIVVIYLFGFIVTFIFNYGGLTAVWEDETICQRLTTIFISFGLALFWFVELAILLLARRK